ncbi:hypothetical protein NDU88_006734 [Pleurodeles waltl]|uniref:Uncharacterized protein n=1 Tax=Pleurodeles waltl TaxID=8319 RepID=A0AAV7TXY9_PLEWA|nr:hypothetical protein NDU88_006734 [Pleurodeles waltl]
MLRKTQLEGLCTGYEDPVPENFFCGPRISEKRFYGRAQDGGRHFACELVASIERSERAACTALGAGSPAHLQPPALEPSPGDYGARKNRRVPREDPKRLAPLR